MRCTVCNACLTDYEATRRHAVTRDFLDICSECLTEICQDEPIPTTDRPDLFGKYDTLGDDDNKELDDLEDF